MAYTYEPFTYNPMGGRPSRPTGLPEATRRQLLEEATRKNGGLLSTIFHVLDTPGAAVRGVLAGDPLSVFGDAERRVTGRELLREYGILDEDEKTYAGFWGGMAAEALLDPLTYVTGGMNSLTKGGRVAKAAGLLDRAPEYLTKKFLAGEAAPEIAERAGRSLEKLGRETISTAEAAGYPLVGKRAARRFGTLNDLIEYAPDSQKAMRDAEVAAGGTDVLADLLSQPLGKSAGFKIGIPGTKIGAQAAFDVPFSPAISDMADAAGTALRWNPASRVIRPIFDKSVAGAIDRDAQILQSGAARMRQDAVEAAGREAGEAQTRLLQGGPDAVSEIMSEEGNRSLGRLIEDPSVNKFATSDADFAERHPAVRQYLQWWEDRADRILNESASAGIGAERFSDPNISGYLPRSLSSPLEIMGQRDSTVGRAISTLTPDQMHRSTATMVPGGRDTIAFELSRDPFLVGNQSASITEKAEHIRSLLGDSVEPKQANELAELLNRLPPDIMKKTPLFGQHPTEMITSYMKRRAGAMADANTIVESLAARATDTPAQFTTGEPTVSLIEALRRTNLQTRTDLDGAAVGASVNLRNALAKRLGSSPDSIELSKYSVPESFVGHLLKAKEVLSNSEAANALTAGLNHYMVMFKSGALTWPARYIRDTMSGGISNYLEGALSVRGIRAAMSLMGHSALGDDFARHLAKIPRYASLAPEQASAQFYGDLLSTGLIDTAKHIDLDTSGMRAASSMVGVEPDTVGRAFKELAPKAGDTTASYAAEMIPINPFTYSSKLRPTSPTTNRFGLLGMRLSEVSDRLNRLSGYLELLMQGVEPLEAAKRIKRVQVDYSSLTPAEKWIRDTIFPFYAYQSRIFQEVMRQIIESPGGRYAQIMRAKVRTDDGNAEGDYIPEYLRDQWAMPIGENSAGQPTFVSNIDVPGLDALDIFDTQAPLQGTARNLALQSAPHTRMLAENAFGRDLFRDIPLEKSKGRDWAGGIAELMPWTGRINTLRNQLTNEYGDSTLAERARNALISNTTGLKFTAPDEQRSMYDAYRVLSEGVEPYSEEDKFLRLLMGDRRRRQASAR